MSDTVGNPKGWFSPVAAHFHLAFQQIFSLKISSDFSVKLVDTGSCSHKTFQGHEAPVLSVAIDPKEEYLVCTCRTVFNCNSKFEPRHEKTNNMVSEQVRHKLSCTSIEAG